jgi:hypothetical protein
VSTTCGTCRRFDQVEGQKHRSAKIDAGLILAGAKPAKLGLCLEDRSRLTTTESKSCEKYVRSYTAKAGT